MRRVILFLGLSLLVGTLFAAAGFVGLSTPGRPVRASGRPPLGLITDTPTTLPSDTPPPVSTATASPTPTVTPTVCLVIFNDVPSDNTFYADIECLACRGIVGGYPCGGPGEPCPGQYYRPGNNVTRGQASKIVSSAAQFADPVPSTQQTFADVPPGSTFWPYIELLVGRGIISGYPCGGAGEPCIAPANRPYFRPNNNVTRGQLSKIVSGAAGYTETPTGQAFVDIPPSHPFYLYVERIAARGTISGYPCGGAGEPCPGVYFRPGNNATRGQMAKIAAQTFYPNCPTCALRWRVAPSPNIGAGDNSLVGVAAVDTDDVWAVGLSVNSSIVQTLAEHWNGTTWSVVPSPNIGTGTNRLMDVAASAGEVWAVGYYSNGSHLQTLTLQWTGTTWRVVPSPNVGTEDNRLWSVTVVNINDAWAVGDYHVGSVQQTLVEHWNGVTWSIVPSPNLPGAAISVFHGVAALNTSDIWAVGLYSYNNGNGNGNGLPFQTLVEHWNGTTWNIVPSPNADPPLNDLWSVVALSPDDAWAVGDYLSGSNIYTLVEHWNGTTWSIVPSPNPVAGINDLLDVVWRAPNDIWAVGYTGAENNTSQTLVEHWDGTAWSVMSSPSPGAHSNSFHSVTVSDLHDVWAVGTSSEDIVNQTLVAHYTLTCP